MRDESGSIPLAAVVLAAGEGKRMRSSLAKVLHEAGGRALLDHVLAALEPLRPNPVVVVVGHLRSQVERHLAGRDVALAVQDPPRGTGDALRCALPLLPRNGTVLVLSGDVPLITPATLRGLAELRGSHGAAAALATAELAEPGAYGRVLRSPSGDVVGIVEARDAGAKELAVREVNAGTYAFGIAALRETLPALRPDNDQGEFYLTDAVGALAARGARVAGLRLADPAEMAGVNSQEELAQVGRLLNARVLRALQEGGVSVLDPETTWVDPDCVVGRGTVLEPGVELRRGCAIGERCRIGAHAVLDGVTVASDDAVVPLAHLVRSR